MRIEERVGAVKQITSGITARSAAFIDALASPAEHHWIDPALNSLAWHLKEAERLLGSHNLNRAEIELDAAEVMLPDAAALEIGDYWFLRGKWHSATGSDDQASTSFQQAHASNPLGKYWAAHVEAQFRICVSDEGPKSYPDIIAQLTGDDPAVISLKSRVLAAEGKLSNAIEVADQIDGPERYMARALAHTIFSKSANALQDCDLGLGTPDLPKNIRRVLLLLRARAKFLLAQASAPTWIEERLPPSGVAGIDPLLVREAWTAIQEAVDALREIGWSSNIDQIADIWCATASMLGKQEEVLPELKAAARLWPRLQTLQDALGSIAAQCGDFTTALEANKRLAPSDTRELQRVLLLHEANKHKECFGWFDSHFDSFDRNNTLFGLAATVASISAYKLSEPNLVKKWSAELDAHSHLKKHAVLLRYYLSIELNRIDNEKALDRLLEDFDELGRPFTIALALLGELDPANEKQAALCVQIAESVCEQVEPSPDMAAHVGLGKV
ncbi:hypothetical protein [Castellaniella sp. GW247-6E4]|uniref:hypothetical protein n=1 Tax=Castellaniella sp. GW247-6E4 TaxID=3140380 RepID=UPI003315B804